MTVLRADCSWCGRVVREGDGPVTHTICPACAEAFENSMIGVAQELTAQGRAAPVFPRMLDADGSRVA